MWFGSALGDLYHPWEGDADRRGAAGRLPARNQQSSFFRVGRVPGELLSFPTSPLGRAPLQRNTQQR